MRKLVKIFFLVAICLLVYNLLHFFIVPENMATAFTSQYRRKLVSVELETTETIEESDQMDEEYAILQNVSQLIECTDKPLKKRVEQRGNYFVLYNYVIAERSFKCFESVTYTTQGDLNFLDNLVPLVERWMGPISVSVYAPGTDFILALRSIRYLRECTTPLIKEYVTFHLFFEARYTPRIRGLSLLSDDFMKQQEYLKCSMKPPYETTKLDEQFKRKNNLVYPINVARNSARLAAQTHFILSSDMELYPSPNFISKFLKMIAKNGDLLQDNIQQVFVIPVFEIEEDSYVPTDKTSLVEMVQNKTAFSFHEHLCRKCHMIPSYAKWLSTPESDDFHIFSRSKRKGLQRSWEPFYVGTNDDPFFDERLSWEGQKNKMTQNYILCVLDYTYLILDNAFLVHRPGIKKSKVQMDKYMELVDETAKLVKHSIKPEIDTLYGSRRGCYLQ